MVKQAILKGETSLGIELGSTRIKAILIDKSFKVLASGSASWENRLENGYWTYSQTDIWTTLQQAYANLADQVQQQYQLSLTTIGTMGVSAMMHGYLVFDKEGGLLTPFRTWRNTTTAQASSQLSQLFQFNIPQRWSIAHLYQAILNQETHLNQIDHLTTLAGYIHHQLTGQKVLGIGDASGIFPIDPILQSYDEEKMKAFNTLTLHHNFNKPLQSLFPKVLTAGQQAGFLTKAGANLLDPSGKLQAGIPFCPPEGDAGTGMVATNSIKPATGNVSAGTSIFAMVVLKESLQHFYPEIDLVTTPTGKVVAMVHCNNGTGDLDAWVNLFNQFAQLQGFNLDKNSLYNSLYKQALQEGYDTGGLLAYNYYAGEELTQTAQGRPLLVRFPDSHFTLPNFMRTLLFSAIATLKIGMDILLEKEEVALTHLNGHGGLFKVEGVAGQLLSNALNTPLAITEGAGEGGAWGMAILAYYSLYNNGLSLEEFLDNNVFAHQKAKTFLPIQQGIEGFNQFMKAYKKGLKIEQTAIDFF